MARALRDIRGAAEGIANLRRIRGDLSKAINAGHEQLAKQAASEMRANAPVLTDLDRAGGDRNPGELRDSIRVETRGNTTEVIVGNRDTFYLGWQEFGSDHQPARPFVRPAAGQAESVHERVMTAEAKKRVK